MKNHDQILRFFLDKEEPQIPGYPAFLLGKADLDSWETDDFNQIYYDLVESFSSNRITLCSVAYKQLKKSKKRLFGGWKPAEFSCQHTAGHLKQELLENSWKGVMFADRELFSETKILWSPYRDHIKRLFILQERLNMALFKKTDSSYEYEGDSGMEITIFPDSVIRNQFTVEDTIDHYRQTDDFLMKLSGAILLPRAYITLNTGYISEQQLIEQLKIVAAKYNKALEIQL